MEKKEELYRLGHPERTLDAVNTLLLDTEPGNDTSCVDGTAKYRRADHKHGDSKRERETTGTRRGDVGLRLAKRRHEMDRKRMLSEQLNETAKRGEFQEAHWLARLLAGRGSGAGRRKPGAASRLRTEERAQALQLSYLNGGLAGLRINFSDEVEKLKQLSDPSCKRPKSRTQILKKEENMIVTRGSAARSVHLGLRKAQTSGILQDVKCLGVGLLGTDISEPELIALEAASCLKLPVENKKKTSRPKRCAKTRYCTKSNGAETASPGVGKKMAEQTQQGDNAVDLVLAAVFGQTRLHAYACNTCDGHLTASATPWAKQLRALAERFAELNLDIATRCASKLQNPRKSGALKCMPPGRHARPQALRHQSVDRRSLPTCRQPAIMC